MRQESGQSLADILRHALRRERRAENRSLIVFRPYRHFIRAKSCPQRSNNFGGHAKNEKFISRPKLMEFQRLPDFPE